MTPEEKACRIIDEKLCQAGWVIQDMNRLNLAVSLGVAVREFPTSTGEVDYALFIDGEPAGVVEAKREEAGQSITDVEIQSGRYANSTFKWVKEDYTIRFAYEATDKLIRFTDYKDIKYRSRTVFSFHRPETLQDLLKQPDTIRNNMKHFALVPEDVEEAYINQHIAVVRFVNSHQGEFMAWYLKSDYGQKELLRNKRGGGKLGLGLDDIRNTLVPIVSDEVSDEVVSEIESRII